MAEVLPEKVVERVRQPRGPLKLHDLLIENISKGGNVQYGIPIRISYNETRTSTNVAHRYIPEVYYSYDVKIDDPLPLRVTGRDRAVGEETFRTTTSEYCVKPNPNKAMERADCAINCRGVSYMTGVEKKLLAKNIEVPCQLSEMKDKFRGLVRPPLAPPDIEVRGVDPEYMFDAVAYTRNEAPVIPETSGGYYRHLDPYVTTYRRDHRPFTADDQYGLAAKDQINFYTERDLPKCRGYGPKYKEVWQPLLSKYHRAIYDRSHVKKEFKEIAANHNPVNNLKGIFVSETKKQFKEPYLSELSIWHLDEDHFLAPFPPNPYQTNTVPFMYCSDYWHIATGTPPMLVIDQYSKRKQHTPCKESFVVSRDR